MQDKKATVVAEDDDSKMSQVVCSLANRDDCLACGS